MWFREIKLRHSIRRTYLMFLLFFVVIVQRDANIHLIVQRRDLCFIIHCFITENS